MTSVLIECIYVGKLAKINFKFLADLFAKSKEARFNAPETSDAITYAKIIKIFESSEYVDFVISTDELKIKGKTVQNVFVNLGLEKESVELLLFFDLNDLPEDTIKNNLNYLYDWMQYYSINYNFDSFICQMDNANNAEYYFDNNGLGPLFDETG